MLDSFWIFNNARFLDWMFKKYVDNKIKKNKLAIIYFSVSVTSE